MSQLLEVLLADGQRISERRAAPPIEQPTTRADQIIAEGDRRRLAARKLNPAADTATVFSAQVGYLHQQVRAMDAELSAFNAVRTPRLSYTSLRLAEVNAAVLVGYTYDPGSPPSPTSARTYAMTGDPGDPGEPDELDVSEVWLNGVDIAAVLCNEAQDGITAELLKRVRRGEA